MQARVGKCGKQILNIFIMKILLEASKMSKYGPFYKLFVKKGIEIDIISDPC